MTAWVGLMGFVQGIILFFVIFRNRKHKSNLYLAWFILLLSVIIFSNAFEEQAFLVFPYLLLFNFLPYLLGPLMYFYFYHSFYGNFPAKYPFRVHTIPAGLDFLFYSLFFFFFDLEEIRQYTRDVFSGNIPFFVVIPESGKMISGVCYSVFIARLLIEFKKDLNSWLKKPKQRQWMLTGALAFSLCWAIVIFNYVYFLLSEYNETVFHLLYLVQMLCFVAVMYIITFFAMRYPELFNKEQVRAKIGKKLNLGEQGLEELTAKVRTFMENEKGYLSDDLTLALLARRLKVHPNALSFVINENFHKNFNEFVNDYRLEHFLSLLKNDADSTILRLAYDSGFSSKSVFNRVFKEKYKKSPSQYRAGFS